MATNGANGHTDGVNGHSSENVSGVFCSAEEFVNTKFDYIVAGGGTAGCVIAGRLTENAGVTVGVIEAGEDRTKDPNVMTPSLYPTLIGREKYDWCMTSIPQETAGNKPYSMPRGKLLGGSSGINYLMYVRGSKADYDGWESLGNKGWGWSGLAPYFKKHQKLDKNEPYHADPQFMPHAGPRDFHGEDGYIKTSFNDWYMPLEKDFADACYDVGKSENKLVDAWSGDHMGFYSSLGAVSRSGEDEGQRSYAKNYITQNLHRKNLKVLTSAHVTKIVLEGNTATGVEFEVQGQKHKVDANKEVILCGGVIHSPQILELSGIGDPEVLKAAGVECKVENKAVGANFQDHVLGGLLFDLDKSVTSLDALHGEEYMKAQQDVYEKTKKGPYGSPGMMMGFVSYASIVTPEELERTVEEVKAGSLAKTDFERRQEKVIIDQLRDPTFANLQTFCIGCRLDVAQGSDQTKFFSSPPEGVQQLSLLMCLEHPLSRGTVHIQSSDPHKQPRIDPGYFRNPADAKILAAGIKWMEEVSKHPLLAKNITRRELPPGKNDLDTEEKRIEYVRNHVSTQYHIMGTCALGEVVDNECRVKGVNKLRVIDSSIFPTHVSGNIMATTYAVAEKGADMIKASA